MAPNIWRTAAARGRPADGLIGINADTAIARGILVAGSPDTVLEQICNVHHELGAGVLDLIFRGPDRDSTRRSIELFADKVLPRVHELD